MTLQQRLTVKSLTNSPVKSEFSILLLRRGPQQLELGFSSIHAQLLPCPINQLNSFLLDFDFLVYLLIVGNSCTEEFELNPLKHSPVLSIGYSYSAQFVDLINQVCF